MKFMKYVLGCLLYRDWNKGFLVFIKYVYFSKICF